MVARKTKQENELSPDDQPSLRREFVRISHPGDKETATVLRTAFESVWKDRGWTVQDDKKSDAANKGESKKENS